MILGVAAGSTKCNISRAQTNLKNNKIRKFFYLEFLTLTERYEVTTLRSKFWSCIKEMNHNREGGRIEPRDL